MKWFLYLIAVLVILTPVLSKDKIPEAVIKAFNSKFPKVKAINWEIEKDVYEVFFKQDGKKIEAEFDKTGNWIYTEREIKKSELPAPVLKKIQTDYPNYKIIETEFLNHSKFGDVFEVELKKGKNVIELILDKAGNIKQKETEQEDKEEKDDD